MIAAHYGIITMIGGGGGGAIGHLHLTTTLGGRGAIIGNTPVFIKIHQQDGYEIL